MSISSTTPCLTLPSLFLASPPLTLKPCFSPCPHRLASKANQKKSYTETVSLRCNAQLLADLAPITSATYGTLLLGGGLFAYSRSGSKGSIIGGLSGAALMSLAYYLMQSPETKEIGDALGFGSAFLFSSVFGIRLVATRKLIPSGLLLAISAGALAVFLSAYLQDKVLT